MPVPVAGAVHVNVVDALLESWLRHDVVPLEPPPRVPALETSLYAKVPVLVATVIVYAVPAVYDAGAVIAHRPDDPSLKLPALIPPTAVEVDQVAPLQLK